MHEIQEKLLKIIESRNIGDLTLREIGDLVGEKLPQKIKHHLLQLERKGFIQIDKKNKRIGKVSHSQASNLFVSLPIVGKANCGPQTIFAEQNIEGFLKVSKKLLPDNAKHLFVLRAQGESLNRAKIEGKNIEDGDYVIVNSKNKSPQSGDYIVSVIDGLANIKKFTLDKEHSRIVLSSESSNKFDPIFVHESDDFVINGKVVSVIKKHKL